MVRDFFSAPQDEASQNPLLKDLNTAQIKAVTTTEGPLLVLAGAGTGKTRVLTSRIAYILQEQRAQPWHIMAVTFTNKAAAEMRSRIQSALLELGIQNGPQVWLGTFHSLCMRILRKHCEALGYNAHFTILDTDDQVRLLKQIMSAEGVDTAQYNPKMVAIMISRWKDKALMPERIATYDKKSDPTVRYLYGLYQERLKLLNCMDFGDLMLLTLQLFQEHPEILRTYHAQFKYILVDEYQDTNVAQYLWLRLLAQGVPNVCCVGDDDQSIYGWRGAEVGNILRFEQDFSGATLIRLEENYRSTSHILDAASALISHNQDRLGKELRSASQNKGEKITLKACWNCDDEARYVGEEIETLQRASISLNDMAILVRASYQTRTFEERLMTLGVPYKVIGGMRFYERAEIRDALAYLRFVYQPTDSLAFERIINVPRRGIGQTTIKTLHEAARNAQKPLPVVARTLMENGTLKSSTRRAFSSFFEHIDRWRQEADTLSPSELMGLILDESGYVSMWQNDKSSDAPQRIENLKELVHALEEFDTLQGFLEHVSLVLENTSDDHEAFITLMTLHGAKGLEFDTVFLPGWEEGLFPNQRSVEEGNLEEERRLAYVGITRAKRKAYITHAGFRRLPQGGRPGYPSQFIHELPIKHLLRIHTHGVIDESDGEQKPYFAPNAAYNQSNYGSTRQEREHFFESQEVSKRSFQQKTSVARYNSGNDRLYTKSYTEGAPRMRKTQAEKKPVLATHTFKDGDRVFHQKFGYGYIHEVEGEKLVIDFETSGRKNIMSDFVRTG